MGNARASIEITASSSRLSAGLAQASAKFQSFAGSISRGMGSAFKKIQPGDTAKRAVGNFGGDLMSGGASAIVDAAQGVREFQSELSRLGIAASIPTASLASLEKSINAVSSANAINRSEIVKAAGIYYDKTSDVEGMATAMSMFGRVAAATGASVEDVTKIGAAMTKIGIEAGEMESAFSGLIAQGSAGSVSLKGMGDNLVSLIPKFKKFGASGRAGLMDLGAAFQVIAEDFGSADEAATAMEATMGLLQARDKQLAGVGIKVFDDEGKLQNMFGIIDQIAKLKPQLRGDILGENKEGRAGIDALIEYKEKFGIVRAAAEDTSRVERDRARRLQDDAGKIDKAFNDMKLAISDALTPEVIATFTQGLAEVASHAGEITSAFKLAADAFGGLAGAGKKIRGAIGGNGGRSFIDVAADEAMVANKQSNLDFMAGRKPFTDQQVAGAKSRLEDDKARKAAQDAILGGEQGERTTPESIRRAVLATNSGRAYGQGKIGESMAGEQYLKAAGVSPEERAKIEQQILADAVPKAIRDGFRSILPSLVASTKPEVKLPEVKLQIGDNQIAQANNAATRGRRGVR